MHFKRLLFASLLVLAIAEEKGTTVSDSSSTTQLDTASSDTQATSSKGILKDSLKTSESNYNVRNQGHDVNLVITDKGSTLDIRPQEGYRHQATDNYGTKGGGGYSQEQYDRGAEGQQDSDYGNYGQSGGYDQEQQSAYGDRVQSDKSNGGYYNADVQQPQHSVQQQHSEPQYNGAPQTGYAVADKQAEHAYGGNQVGHSSAGYASSYELPKQPAYESFTAEGKDAGSQYQVIPANDQYSQGYSNGAQADYGHTNAGYGNSGPVETKTVVSEYGNGGHAPAPDYSQQHQYQQPGNDYGAQGGNGYKINVNNEPKYDYGGFRPIIKPQEYTNNGYNGPQQGNAYVSGGHTAKVILVPAQDVLPAKGSQFQYQTNLDHTVKNLGKPNHIQEAGHIVDYGSAKPYGGNLAQKPYSTDYVAGVKTAVPVKEAYDTGAYIQQPKATYGDGGTGYGVQQISPQVGYTPELGDGYATNGYSNSNILKGPMLGTNYEVNIDALLNTIPSSHGSYGGTHHSSAPILSPMSSAHEMPFTGSLSPGGLTSSYNPSLSSSFYAAASSPSFSSPNYGGFGLESYATPEVSYAPPMSRPPPVYGHPVYSNVPKFGSFADYTTAADSLLSGSFNSGFGYAPKFTNFSPKPSFPSFRGAYNSVYGYAAASNRIPFVLKAPSSLKNMVKALTGQV